jgi:hypothetical protein
MNRKKAEMKMFGCQPMCSVSYSLDLRYTSSTLLIAASIV